MEFLFSDEIRSKIDKMPEGKVFKMHDLAEMLNVSQEDYKSRSPRLNAIMQEKVSLGSLAKLKVGVYKKIKTVKTIKKRTGTKPNWKPKEKAQKKVSQELGFVIYRGVIYNNIVEFSKKFNTPESVCSSRIKNDFFEGYAIFKTKSAKEAKYYAETFYKAEQVNSKGVRNNGRD